jgi:hypothetical protein
MIGEIGKTSAKSRIQSDAPLSVEIRVRERDAEMSASEGGGGPVTAAEGALVRWLVLVVVLAIAGIYVGIRIGSGWVPADDGTLSQSALRVLRGQLPHRDFAEIYTGGLSFIHALAFRAFGVNLMSLRICVFLFFLAWLPAVYYIALRFTSALGAGAITLLAVSWSYPNYPAAMPSWYNLFFATFGAAALLRYLEVRTRRWLFVAGVCGGVSILIKIIGVYYIAGVLLFLAFLEQSESLEDRADDSSQEGAKKESSKSSWTYRGFSAAALLLYLMTLVKVLNSRLGPPEWYQFVLPSAVVVGLILLGERNVRVGTGQRFKTILRTAGPFVCGMASPIIVFLVPYARSGMVGKFLFGVTSSVILRSVALGLFRPFGAEKVMYALPLVGFLAAAMYWDKFQGRVVGATLGLAAVVLAVKSRQSTDVLMGIWLSAAVLTPLVVLLGAVLVWIRRKPGPRGKLERQQVVLLIALAATCSLVQFPLAVAIYLSYAAPLTILALLAIVCTNKTQRGTYALASVVALYMAFEVFTLIPHSIYEITYLVGHVDAMQEPRAGGLKIGGAEFFDDLARFLREHSPNGLMFAGNDCPELYFLSGLTNVARDDGGGPPAEFLKAIRSDNLDLVVINDAPFFPGGRMQPEVRAEVEKRFPHSTRFGIFEVFWKQ